MPRWTRGLYARAADAAIDAGLPGGCARLYAQAADAGIAARLAVLAPAAALLIGCGQSGPLTLPNRDAGTAPVSEISPPAEAGPVAETAPKSAEDSEDDAGDPDSDDEEQDSNDE